jgi:hypothetical protein
LRDNDIGLLLVVVATREREIKKKNDKAEEWGVWRNPNSSIWRHLVF